MKKEFSIPSIESISYSGMIDIEMSSKIIVPSFSEMLYYFKKGQIISATYNTRNLKEVTEDSNTTDELENELYNIE